MARQRKNIKNNDSPENKVQKNEKNPEGKSSSEGTGKIKKWEKSKSKKQNDSKDKMSNLKLFIVSNCIAFFFVGLYLAYRYRIEHTVTTPINLPKVVSVEGIGSNEKYWGSYRSGHYFGMKTRHPNSPVVGLMWFPQRIIDNTLKVRHWCDLGDGLKRYSWLQHDGVNFGIQEIEDDAITIKTSFVKRHGGKFGGDWTARISITPNKKTEGSPMLMAIPHSFLIYIATDGDGSISPVIQDDGRLVTVAGYAESLGSFNLHFIPKKGGIVRFNYLNTIAPNGLQYLKEVVLQNLAVFKSKIKDQLQVLGLRGDVFPPDEAQSTQGNFIAHQVTVFPPFDMELVFESGSFIDRPNRLEGHIFDQELKRHKENFENKFSDVFQLPLKGYSKEETEIAQAIFSNLIGGIGYFHGKSYVQSEYSKDPIEYWASSLYTAVPSRSTFPRGFLWDEGFHNLVINRWDPVITKDILGHWLDFMNADGWIPRELILGDEARARVPAEFVVQHNSNANPPTLLLSYDILVRRMVTGEIEKDIDFLKKSYSRLKAWFNWFNTTQIGKEYGTYRWRGRNPGAINELNPKTLTSGLDDYPRASDPTDDERHVDLRCWMAFAANVMQEIGRMVGESWSDYATTFKYLSDNDILEKLHWSSSYGSFCDYGLHTPDVKLITPRTAQPDPPKVRAHLSPPKYQFVNSFGYVSLFPLMLQILKPENPVLSKVLTDMKNPKLLWTNYGLRSLAKTAPLYQKRNTEHDPPYWRGAIWMNMNYLVLKALNYYSEIPGPYQDEAFGIYKELRKNVVSNILKEYKRTGYVYENYNDINGHGQGSHPFTGWTSTVVLIMAEIY